MIYMPKWKVNFTLLMCVLALLYAAPNIMGAQGRAWVESHLPSWFPTKTVNLGLDLRGGSHLLLQVDVDSVIHDRSENLVQSARPELRKEKVAYTSILGIPGGVRLRLRDGEDPDRVKKILRKIDRDVDVIVSEDKHTLEARLTEEGMKQIKDQTIGQSIEIVRRRVDEAGTQEPLIQRQGDDRIILQLPGVDNPQRIKDILGRTAKLTFHLVDTGSGGETKDAGGTIRLPMSDQSMGMETLSIYRRPMLTGDMLTNAQPSFDQGGQPVVSFNLNGIGARRFCDVTRNNVNKPFAIVLDEKVISAPNIREPICGGAAQISGSFTLQEVNDLSLLLRAGALPAPLHVMEERTVGPTLGADSVAAGMKACIYAFVFVVIYMTLIYGLFGIFASAALFLNMIAIIAVMSMLQAVLTLPGIAGIVLTIGLAVDANVLVFERIKEELRDGRSIMSAIDTGYARAKTTITDSNLTALIAALILFSFGTGPIKGFAVTMCIGIVTSFFSCLMLTRLIVLSWLLWKKPKEIAV